MGWFKKLRLQAKLMLVFSLIVLVGAFSLLMTLSAVNRLQGDVSFLSQQSETIANFQRIYTLLLIQQEEMEEFVLLGDEFALGRALAAQQEAVTLINEERLVAEAEYVVLDDIAFEEPILLADAWTIRRYENVVAIDEAVNAYHEGFVDAIATYESGDTDAAITLVEDSISSQREQLDTIAFDVEELILSEQVFTAEEVEVANAVRRNTVTFGTVSMIALFLLAAAGSVLTNRIATPLSYLNNAVTSFENQQYNPELIEDERNRGDDVGELIDAFMSMVETIKRDSEERERMLTASKRFVPEAYLDFLSKPSITDINLGDHIAARMTVMFSDIRGFTTMSEDMTPAENFNFVNVYLKQVSPFIQLNNGFIVKFLGDGMMAIFPYNVDDAVEAGLAKQRVSIQVGEEMNAHINLGIGIHLGDMMVGMIGEELRLQGDAFSDNVNLTARIEGLNKTFRTAMLISEDARSRMRDANRYAMRPIGRVQVKGKDVPIQLYEIFEAAPPEEKELKLATLPQYTTGIELFQAGDLTQARETFAQVLTQNPNDGTAQYFIELCDTLQQDGALDHWDGTIIMTSK